MSHKSTLIAGLFGAAAIVAARKLPMSEKHLDSTAANNGRGVPIVNQMAAAVPSLDKNGWSGFYWILPAVGAYYLSR